VSWFLSLVGCKKQLSERNKEEGDGFVTDYSRLRSDNSSYHRLALKLYVICVVRCKNFFFFGGGGGSGRFFFFLLLYFFSFLGGGGGDMEDFLVGCSFTLFYKNLLP